MPAHIVYEETVTIPSYATPGSAGVDLYAHLPGPCNKIFLYPKDRVVVSTGIAVEIPSGFEAQIRPNSTNAELNGVTVLNSPGTIDSDYRGVIRVIMINFGDAVFEISNNLKIAKLVVCKVQNIRWKKVKRVNKTERNANGFGSTGEGSYVNKDSESGSDSDV